MADIGKYPSLEPDIVFEATTPGISAITFDGKHLWQSDAQSDTLFMTDPDEGTRLRSIPCPNTSSDLSSDGNFLWQIVKTPRWLRCLNPNTGSIVSELKIEPTDAHPSGVCIDGNYFWLALSDKGVLQKRSLNNGLLVKQFKVSRQVAGICVTKHHIWYSDKNGFLIGLDPQTGTEMARYQISGMPLSLASDGERFWYFDCVSKTIFQVPIYF